MPAPKGNQFWLARSSHGANPKFSDPDILWKVCCEYFQWVEDNPLLEDKPFNYQGVVIPNTVIKMRAMTISGLCIFLDVVATTWGKYREDKDLMDIVTQAEAVIRNQKFTGAAADMLNPSIIARDLGLTDKKETTSSVSIIATPLDEDI